MLIAAMAASQRNRRGRNGAPAAGRRRFAEGQNNVRFVVPTEEAKKLGAFAGINML